MLRKRKIIKGLYRLDPVAVFLHEQEVIHKGLGVAGDVEDLVHAVAEELWQDFVIHTGTGRVHYDDVRFFREFVQYLQDVPCDEAAVFFVTKKLSVRPTTGNMKSILQKA